MVKYLEVITIGLITAFVKTTIAPDMDFNMTFIGAMIIIIYTRIGK